MALHNKGGREDRYNPFAALLCAIKLNQVLNVAAFGPAAVHIYSRRLFFHAISIQFILICMDCYLPCLRICWRWPHTCLSKAIIGGIFYFKIKNSFYLNLLYLLYIICYQFLYTRLAFFFLFITFLLSFAQKKSGGKGIKKKKKEKQKIFLSLLRIVWMLYSL